MTQRVARPIKFAAFISIIVSVAVMFVACQGAVGKAGDKGEKGDKGDPGDPGDTGTAGAPGFTPLQLKGDAPFIVINDAVEDAALGTTAGEAGEPFTINLAEYFRGGTSPFTFKLGVRVNDDIDFELVDGGPMLKLSVVADTSEDVTNTSPVTITDADGSTLDFTISARRNNPPTPESDTALADGVGTQVPEMAVETPGACPQFNECTSANVLFAEAQDANNDEILTFSAVSADATKVVVVSAGTAVGVDGVAVPLAAGVVVRGIASTWVADNMPDQDGDQAGHLPVAVTVTATDRGDLTATRTLNVSVDSAPTVKPLPGGSMSQATPTYEIANVEAFFNDAEGEELSYGIESSDVTVATAELDTTGTDITKVIVTRNSMGSATITVTASEADGSSTTPSNPDQTVKASFTVTVTN